MNVIEKTLKLMDQMSFWIPKLKRYKSDEAQAYGFTAFLIVAVVSFLSGSWSVGLPVSLLIGVIVWLYFRYEKRREADLQIQEFKAWKQKFEEEKEAFLETM
jgi:c-di-AMP phosphodiesterase-like protein